MVEARRTVDSYIADLKAAAQIGFDLKLFKMSRLGIPHERISTRLGELRETIKYHLVKMAALPNLPNNDLEKGFTVSQTAEKHGWPESLLWSIKLKEKDDFTIYQELQWGLRTWDKWYWTDCLPREIHVNDSSADFTGAIKDSVTIGPEGYLLNS